MANKRMFSLKVVDTDVFLDMSPSAQNLYFHLGMRADDDGFVSSPKKIMVMVNASEDDMKILIAKNFIIKMATNGIAVITHWHMNNLIRADRYQETEYKGEKDRLELVNGKYSQSIGIPNVIPNGNQVQPQVRLGKVRLGKTDTTSPKSLVSILDDETTITLLKEKFSSVPVSQEIEKMKDWLASKGIKKKDYVAFARIWLRKYQDEKTNKPNKPIGKKL